MDKKKKKALGEGTLCMSVDSSFFVPRKAPSRALSRELFCTPKSSLGHFRGSFFVPQKAPWGTFEGAFLFPKKLPRKCHQKALRLVWRWQKPKKTGYSDEPPNYYFNYEDVRTVGTLFTKCLAEMLVIPRKLPRDFQRKEWC